MNDLKAYLNRDQLMISVENLPEFKEKIARIEELEDTLSRAIKDLRDYEIQVSMQIVSRSPSNISDKRCYGHEEGFGYASL